MFANFFLKLQHFWYCAHFSQVIDPIDLTSRRPSSLFITSIFVVRELMLLVEVQLMFSAIYLERHAILFVTTSAFASGRAKTNFLNVDYSSFFS